MFLELIPASFGHIGITSFLLYCAYWLGTRKTDEAPVPDKFFSWLIKVNLWAVIFTYAEAIFLEALVMSEEELPIEYRDQEKTTKRWLEQHNYFFWVSLSFHQIAFMAILLYELVKVEKMMKMVWFVWIPPFLQVTVGLFSQDKLGPAILGLIMEMITPLLAVAYAAKMCTPQPGRKYRAMFGLCAVVSYIISVLPVLFLGSQMQTANHALYLTMVFGFISFGCWGKISMVTPENDKNKEKYVELAGQGKNRNILQETEGIFNNLTRDLSRRDPESAVFTTGDEEFEDDPSIIPMTAIGKQSQD